MAKLKVYGGLISRSGRRRQVRVIVAARSGTAARSLIENQANVHLSYNEWRDYWSETWNDGELAAASEAGDGVVLWAPEDPPGRGAFRPWNLPEATVSEHDERPSNPTRSSA